MQIGHGQLMFVGLPSIVEDGIVSSMLLTLLLSPSISEPLAEGMGDAYLIVTLFRGKELCLPPLTCS